MLMRIHGILTSLMEHERFENKGVLNRRQSQLNISLGRGMRLSNEFSVKL